MQPCGPAFSGERMPSQLLFDQPHEQTASLLLHRFVLHTNLPWETHGLHHPEWAVNAECNSCATCILAMLQKPLKTFHLFKNIVLSWVRTSVLRVEN